jgi:hypothetical protein
VLLMSAEAAVIAAEAPKYAHFVVRYDLYRIFA